MSANTEFDLGSLIWVKGEIDQTLEKARHCLSKYSESRNVAELKFTQTHLHQVRGAVEMVGLYSLAKFAEELEVSVGTVERGDVAADKVLPIVGEAIVQLTQFLEAVVNGAPNIGLKLRPTYRTVRLARGEVEASGADLFFPSLSGKLPAGLTQVQMDEAARSHFLKTARRRFEAGLLKWLKGGKTEGAQWMSQALLGASRTQQSTVQRGFWWAAAALCEGLTDNRAELDVNLQQLLTRLNLQLRRLSDGSVKVAERLYRDVLYVVAHLQTRSPHVHGVRRAFDLEAQLPKGGLEDDTKLLADTQLARELKDLLNQAKDNWARVSSGAKDRVAQLREQLAGLADKGDKLKLVGFSPLANCVANVLGHLQGAATESVALEVATALLLLENAVMALPERSSEFPSQSTAMINRLELGDAAPEVNLLDDVSRRAQERMLLTQVSQEIQSNLRFVEQVLDGFFRDTATRHELVTVDAPLRQIRGALMMLDQQAARELLEASVEIVTRCQNDSYDAPPEELEFVAEALSSVGFYIDALQREEADCKTILLPSLRKLKGDAADIQLTGAVPIEAEVGPEEMAAVLEDEIQATAVPAEIQGQAPAARQAETQPAATAIAPEQEATQSSKRKTVSEAAVDAELLEVYLEEAVEVLANIAEHLALLKDNSNDKDAMTVLRRGFHTLKGSGRMVGLNNLGEVAWVVEQVMNSWLQDEKSATDNLLQLVGMTHDSFVQWVGELQQTGAAEMDASEIFALAEQLRSGVEAEPVATTVVAADELPAEQDAAQHRVSEAAVPAEVETEVSLDTMIGPVTISKVLFGIFLDEAHRHFSTLSQAFADFNRNGEMRTEIVHAAHTLCGISNTTGFLQLGELGSAIEQVVMAYEKSGATLEHEDQAVLALAIDQVGSMVGRIGNHGWPDAEPQTIAMLNLLANRLHTPPRSAFGGEQAGEQDLDEHDLLALDADLPTAPDDIDEFAAPLADAGAMPVEDEVLSLDLPMLDEGDAEMLPTEEAPALADASELAVSGEAAPAAVPTGFDLTGLSLDALSEPDTLEPLPLSTYEVGGDEAEGLGEFTLDLDNVEDGHALAEQAQAADDVPLMTDGLDTDDLQLDTVLAEDGVNLLDLTLAAEPTDVVPLDAALLGLEAGATAEPLAVDADLDSAAAAQPELELEPESDELTFSLDMAEDEPALTLPAAALAVDEPYAEMQPAEFVALTAEPAADVLQDSLRVDDALADEAGELLANHAPISEYDPLASEPDQDDLLEVELLPAHDAAVASVAALAEAVDLGDELTLDEALPEEPALDAFSVESAEASLTLPDLPAASEAAPVPGAGDDLEIDLSVEDLSLDDEISLDDALPVEHVAEPQLAAVDAVLQGMAEDEPAPELLLEDDIAIDLSEADGDFAIAEIQALEELDVQPALSGDEPLQLDAGLEVVDGGFAPVAADAPDTSFASLTVDDGEALDLTADQPPVESVDLTQLADVNAATEWTAESGQDLVLDIDSEAPVAFVSDAAQADGFAPDAQPWQDQTQQPEPLLAEVAEPPLVLDVIEEMPSFEHEEPAVAAAWLPVTEHTEQSYLPAATDEVEASGAQMLAPAEVLAPAEADALVAPLPGVADGIDVPQALLAEDLTRSGGNAASGSKLHDIVVLDELDEQLLPIFIEEAQELLPQISTELRHLRVDSSAVEPLDNLRRQLHTLKGSARMAGAMRLGEATHNMETRLLNAGGHMPMHMVEELETDFDVVNEFYDRLVNGEPKTEVPAVEAAVPGIADTAALAAPAPAAARGPVAQPLGLMDMESGKASIRVRADLVDRLVNQAGEVSISRSRIESEMLALKRSLLDLTDNVGRLRTQLREIEIQAESQMQSQLSQVSGLEGFDPLEFDRFTRLQELTRFMAESVNDVATVQHNLLKNLDESNAALIQQARMTRDLQQELMRVRMVPFGSVSDRLYRLVRQTGKETGKKVNLELRGARVEIDRSVLEKMVSPFEHMLRNAIDHGLERPDTRLETGKNEFGEIVVEARQEGNELVLLLRDDGAGLNISRIRDKGIEKGLISAAEQYSDSHIMQLIFEAGFSTASVVSQLSGRGIGMDVVKNEIEDLGGRVEVTSEQGRGTTFTIHLPLTLAVTQAVLIKVGEKSYAIPSVMVEQVQEIKVDVLEKHYHNRVVEWMGNSYPFHYLPRLIGEYDHHPEQKRYNTVMLLRSGVGRIAIHVDKLVKNQEVVVKNIGPQLARAAGVAGATVLGNGEIVLILNPLQLALRRAEAPVAVHDTVVAASQLAAEEALNVTPVVMVVDDSLTVRKITGRLLAREGFQVETAKDGIDALQQLQDIRPAVMLVDVEMPRMDGFELTRNVRANAATRDIPIIMITSRTADKHKNYAFELGVNVFLGKPYQEDELLNNIRRLIEEAAVTI